VQRTRYHCGLQIADCGLRDQDEEEKEQEEAVHGEFMIYELMSYDFVDRS